MTTRVVRVPQITRVVRAVGGTPSIIRTQVVQTRVVRGGIPGPQGKTGKQGPPGVSGGVAVRHEQQVPAAVWPITHNLGRYPQVTVVDSAGDVVLVDIHHLDLNRLEVRAASPFSGIASAS